MSEEGLIFRPMMDYDLEGAQAVHRLAFGTFFKAPDPRNFRPESQAVVTRYRTDPRFCFVADAGIRGQAIRGSAVVMDWGSVGILGPLTVHPDYWNKGIARSIMTQLSLSMMSSRFSHMMLHTHPESPLHLRLYQQFGYWPGAMTAIMAKSVEVKDTAAVERLTQIKPTPRKAVIVGCRNVANAVFAGLDLTREIEGAAKQNIGDTVVLRRDKHVRGFAVCHYGQGSEARKDSLYVKFGAVAPGDAEGFEQLVSACEQLAGAVGAKSIGLGVNTGRLEAYRALLKRGYRVERYGVTMYNPEGPCWDLADRYVIDDLR
jgi:ribosomal protein S18 acetylase RimI-like enzyme